MLHWHLFAHLLSLAFCFGTSNALTCYQCNGTVDNDPFQCNEVLGNDIDLVPESCDSVYGAKYCVKHTGRFEAYGIDCYQCTTANQLECADGMISFGGLQPQNCSHVFEAQYCIKSISYGGGVGTKRFCSSVDLGNYCNYVQQPGDTLNYRTCIHTCSENGCNLSNYLIPLTVFKTVTVSIVLVIFGSFIYR